MGINVLNNTSSQEIITTAGANLTSGDLIINAESGKAFAASNALTIAQNNNTTAGTSALVANTTTGSANYYGYYQSGNRSRICQLSNGTLVSTYNGNGTDSVATNVTIVFKTLLNGGIVAPIVISDSGIYWSAVKALSSGFVVFWGNNSNELRFAIYGNDGSTILASTVVSSNVNISSDSIYFDVGVTTNNEIVVAYSISSDGGMFFRRYNSSGVLQGSTVTVEAGVVNRGVKVLPDSSGGFLIYYYRNTATNAYKFARYNSSGVLQGSLTTVISTGNSLIYGNLENLAVRLSGGGFVLFAPLSGYSQAGAYVYDSSGTLLQTVDYSVPATNGTSFQTNQTIPGICLTGTGFTVFFKGTSAPGNFAVYNASGGQLQGRTTTAFSSWSDTIAGATYDVYWNLIDLGNAGYMVVASNYNSSALTYFILLCFNSSGGTIGSATTIVTSGSNRQGQISSILTSDGSVFYTFTQNTANSSIAYGMYAVQRKSVVGVAQTTVAANSNVRIATTGSYTINSNFFAGGNFDQRTATVPGTKGTVTGSSAVLFGMS